MAVWIKKNFNNKSFDVVLRDFRQHFFAMGAPQEMLMIQSSEGGNVELFVHLPVERHQSFYVGFAVCAEADLPAFSKLLAGSEAGYRAMVQKRAANREKVTEPVRVLKRSVQMSEREDSHGSDEDQ